MTDTQHIYEAWHTAAKARDTAALIALAALPASAQQLSDAEREAKMQALLAQADPGPKTVDLGAQASLQLPAGMAFLPKKRRNGQNGC